MTNFLGMHWQRQHPDQRDLDHVRKMAYGSFTLFEPSWSDRDFCNQLLDAAPDDAIFLLRHHGRSEQKGEMYAEPKRMGIEHAEEWGKDVPRIHLPLERVYMCGINEPDTNHAQWATNEYETWRVRRMNELGLPAGVWCFGTGHPSTYDLKPENDPNWEWYQSSYEEMKKGRNIGVVHEYGLPTNYMWGNNCNRLQYCPWDDIQFIIQESGIDGGTGGRPGVGYRGYGMAENEYADWLQGYFNRMLLDPRVHSVQVFTYDFAHPWGSFDIRVMRDTLEARWAGGVSRPEPPVEPPTDIDDPPDTPITSFKPFDKAMEFILKHEGGYVDDPFDPGGETKYGISKRAHPNEDIKNLTIERAKEIYFTNYWQSSGADRMPWPLAIVHFDSAVNTGLGQAAWFLERSNKDAFQYIAERIQWYTGLSQWSRYGAGWTRRMADLLREAAV